MPDVTAIEAEVGAIGETIKELDMQIWAILAPYEVYSSDDLVAVGNRMIQVASEVNALEGSRQALYQQIDDLYAALNAAQTGVPA